MKSKRAIPFEDSEKLAHDTSDMRLRPPGREKARSGRPQNFLAEVAEQSQIRIKIRT